MEAHYQRHVERDKAEIIEWMRGQVAGILDLSPAEVQPQETLMSYGLDSCAAVAMTEMLSRWLGRDVAPTLLFDYPTIDGLATALHERVQ